MKPIACDVVILPPDPVKSLVIELSKKANSDDFHLNYTDLLPHITLAMGFCDDFDLLSSQIAKVARQLAAFEVTVEKICETGLMVLKSKPIFQLHEQLVSRLSLNIDPREKDIEYAYLNYPQEVTTKHTIEWIRNFNKDHGGRNYIPHITFAWEGKFKKMESGFVLPQKFTATEIVLCRLGNFNTCRKVLGRFPLSG